jgi:hypothetical protein
MSIEKVNALITLFIISLIILVRISYVSGKLKGGKEAAKYYEAFLNMKEAELKAETEERIKEIENSFYGRPNERLSGPRGR